MNVIVPKRGAEVKNKLLMYLEEYARLLSDQRQALLEEQERDGDVEAGQQAEQLDTQIFEIRKIVSYLSRGGELRD